MISSLEFGIAVSRRMRMEKWRCTVCDYVYDPALGDPDGSIPPNTSFESLPEDWQCPICGVGKDEFEKVT
jgi:rubredoxin